MPTTDTLLERSAAAIVDGSTGTAAVWTGFRFPSEFLLCGTDGRVLFVSPVAPPAELGVPAATTVGSELAVDAYVFAVRPQLLPANCAALHVSINRIPTLAMPRVDSMYSIHDPIFATAALLYHEAFHRYQKERFAPTMQRGGPRQYVALESADEIPRATQTSLEFQTLAIRERALLVDALRVPTIQAKRRILQEYLSLRVRRMALLPDDLRASEPHEERKEASAQLVGYFTAARALNLSHSRVRELVVQDLLEAPRFDAPGWAIGAYRQWHIYATGAAIGLLLEDLDVPWKDQVERGATFVSLLTSTLEQRP